ncbi:MAG: peptide ABC transporter substrate-binding protein [Trueperaceae bacterium]|nr:MAG: peptide ABC transporter substrate-binding protein [Trueperaceae bacterium]
MTRPLRLILTLSLAMFLGLAAAQETVFRMATFEPNSLDPAIGGPGYQEYVNLYEALVDAYAKDGELRPLAAESWEINDDGTVFTFTLRQGLRWSDGEPVTMHHYRDGWMRMLDPATAAYQPQNLFAILNAEAYNLGELDDPSQVGLEVLDDHTLRVTLETATPFFLRSVGRQEFFPMRLDLIELHGDQWMEAGNHVGNGPYMLETWQHDQRMVFVKNPYYEGEWKDNRHVDRIEYTLLGDPWGQSVPGFETGELDVGIVPPADLERVRDDPVLSQRLQPLPISGAVIMVFDTGNGVTADVLVRRALAQAIDYDVLANAVLRGAFAPATSFSPPELESHDPSTRLPTDVEAAQALLAEAGYPGGQGFPSFTLYYWSLQRESLLAQAIQAMWAQNLGIQVQLQSLEPAAMTAYRNSRADEPFDAYLALNWAGMADPHQFHNNQIDPARNVRHSRYDDAAYVDLIRRAITHPDLDERVAMYQEAEGFVNQDVPILSLVYEARTWLVAEHVEHFGDVVTSIAEMLRVAAPPGLRVTR